MKRILTLAMMLTLVLLPLGCGHTPAATAGDAVAVLLPPSAGNAAEATAGDASAADAGVEVQSYDELISALNDTSVARAHISADITISSAEEQTFEREGFVLVVDEGATVTFDQGLILVFCGSDEEPGIVVNGTLKVAGTLNFGAMTLMNNGTLEVLSGGTLAPGMSTMENYGTVVVDQGGEIRLERGSSLQNFANVVNQGTIQITDDGGSLYNSPEATLKNDGHIAFDGNYQNEGTYTGGEEEPQGAMG
jgi:hypothetical protein